MMLILRFSNGQLPCLSLGFLYLLSALTMTLAVSQRQFYVFPLRLLPNSGSLVQENEGLSVKYYIVSKFE